jgi:hypothetical protein
MRQQQPNNSKPHGALAKMGNMQAELETLNQQRVPRDPAILLDLQKHLVC